MKTLKEYLLSESKLGESNEPQDPPAVLIMKRKSIRQFPNGQRVALYFVDKINKYVTVPYTAMQWSVANMPEEVNVIDQLKQIVEAKEDSFIVFPTDETVEIEYKNAEQILEMYGKLTDENKAKLANMVNEGIEQFSKVKDFASKI